MKIREQALGEEHPDTLGSVDRTYKNQGQRKEAQAQREDSLADMANLVSTWLDF